MISILSYFILSKTVCLTVKYMEALVGCLIKVDFFLNKDAK